ncbi:MAG: glycerophosphodiester phosphodiesterase [Candidatus Hodarchaeales archaeon]
MTYIIAHRGFCKVNEPDNSLPAFQAALEANADGIEFDINLSSDGHFVCFHDPSLTKLGRSEQLNELKLEELTEIELSEGVTIPSLEDVLEKFGNKILLNIELKPQKNGAKELIHVIHQYNLDNTPNKVIISSFHGEALAEIKKIDPDIPTGLLVNFARNQLPIAQKLGCDALHPYYDKIPEGWTNLPYWIASWFHKYYAHKCFDEAKNKGILINPYTVNSDPYLLNCFKRNVYGVITDDVDRAYQIKQYFD